MKSIAADVHMSSITFTTLNEAGKILNQKTVATSEKSIREYVAEIKGKKQLTFEEGPLAQWMVNIVSDDVDRVVVCNPRRNALIYKGHSNDTVDSKQLAELLRLGALQEVYHSRDTKRQSFRELMNTYFKINQDITRSKNRLKSVFRMKGILCAGQKIYSKANHDDWKKKLTGWSTTQNIAEIYWSQLSMLENQKSVMLSEIKKQSRPFKEIKEFLKLPGVGLVTASTFSAFIVTPWRFKNKAKVWAYCNLSLIENDTGKKLNKEVEMKRQRKILRRLTRDGNRRLKSVLKTAAGVACHRANDNDYKTMYQSLRARGLDESSAMLTISRKLACQLWGIWKRVETNQPIIT